MAFRGFLWIPRILTELQSEKFEWFGASPIELFNLGKKRKKGRSQTQATLENFHIGPSVLRIAQHQAPSMVMTSRNISAQLFSTDVELHRRANCNEVLTEASILLECRHPNILLMLGFTLNLDYGPVLIMEKFWGSASKALYSQRLHAITAIRIADQVATALHYLFRLRIHHGAVNIHNVVLSDPPDHPSSVNVVAKLTDFSNAKLGVNDNRVLDRDMRAYGVLTSNLFVEDISNIVRFDKSISEVDQEMVMLNLEAIRTDYPELVELLIKLVSPTLTTAREVDERFSKLHLLLRLRGNSKHTTSLVHWPGDQVLRSPLSSAEATVQP